MMSDELVTEGEPNVSIRTEQDMMTDVLGALLGETLFGALHLLAWSGPFPTHAETILWRVASLVCLMSFAMLLLIFASIIFFIFVAALVMVYVRAKRNLHEDSSITAGSSTTSVTSSFSRSSAGMRAKMENFFGALKETCEWEILKRCGKLYTTLFASLYAVCRICIVLECYRTLAYATDEVFQRPDWSRYLIHV
ncbi:hypothetical protein QBC34DRAFT_412949 [Podospora aff. communis PSN243]|uniref:Uncharacterized protein n=1 Tax=Podospora aff. communis PSN243 TaxID=3040156 RepID=A0AAV9GES3_9PEZI|nr:hypothetical protein QBC34DRAFT_412949 [Podospora aff. communis PSN243]